MSAIEFVDAKGHAVTGLALIDVAGAVWVAFAASWRPRRFISGHNTRCRRG